MDYAILKHRLISLGLSENTVGWFVNNAAFAMGIIINTSFLIGNWVWTTSQVILTTGKFGKNGRPYILNMVEGTIIAAVNDVLTTTTSLCLVAKVVVIYRPDMNDHSKHSVCFISSEISMYLTEIPECQQTECIARWMFLGLSTNGMLHFILSDIKALEYNKLIITTS